MDRLISLYRVIDALLLGMLLLLTIVSVSAVSLMSVAWLVRKLFF